MKQNVFTVLFFISAILLMFSGFGVLTDDTYFIWFVVSSGFTALFGLGILILGIKQDHLENKQMQSLFDEMEANLCIATYQAPLQFTNGTNYSFSYAKPSSMGSFELWVLENHGDKIDILRLVDRSDPTRIPKYICTLFFETGATTNNGIPIHGKTYLHPQKNEEHDWMIVHIAIAKATGAPAGFGDQFPTQSHWEY